MIPFADRSSGIVISTHRGNERQNRVLFQLHALPQVLVVGEHTPLKKSKIAPDRRWLLLLDTVDLPFATASRHIGHDFQLVWLNE